ncbi:MAG: hypothetical protein ACLRWP_15850 [Bilophila wadsworthia]
MAERAPVLQRNARLLPPFADPAEALGRLPDGLSARGIPDLRRALDLAELARLFHLAGRSHHTLTQLIHNCAAAESGKCELLTSLPVPKPSSRRWRSFSRPAAHVPLHLRDGGRPCPDLRIIQTLLRLATRSS